MASTQRHAQQQGMPLFAAMLLSFMSNLVST
jgi:hypothetical protein